ncbi:hypothetical protein [Amycolatopsis sp. H20-H5]|uniref:hypothetical protein n=1 Tax=Amycolatopsis sp. H20-H5 TaxID=3046309 RepID=UPI002DB57E71|nr:hypothetical protein [Amycolatopsis sp. H20-H5]MEC3974656.1 hypothetical protein [Amycolatopsis sp. H20-H5]
MPFEDIKPFDFWTTDTPPAGGAAAPASGQGFSMDSDHMREMLKKARANRKFIDDQRAASVKIAKADSPADEPASNNAVNAHNGVNETGKYYLGHLDYQFNYHTELILGMERALGLTEEIDRQAAENLKNQGKYS